MEMARNGTRACIRVAFLSSTKWVELWQTLPDEK